MYTTVWLYSPYTLTGWIPLTLKCVQKSLFFCPQMCALCLVPSFYQVSFYLNTVDVSVCIRCKRLYICAWKAMLEIFYLVSLNMTLEMLPF